MNQCISRLVANSRLCQSMYRAEIEFDTAMDTFKPGQFVTVRVGASVVPLLRRPFAVASAEPRVKRASFIYQVRGSGTEMLSNTAPGATLDIIGPLGKPFPLPDSQQFSVLIAGGIGLGPVLFLADTLQQAGYACSFVFGCRSGSFIPERLFDGRNVVVCTDDGSTGFKGTVVSYLESIAGNIPENARIYCCGPEPMLKGCHLFAQKHQFSCFVSVEQVMACGVGACMGCAVKMAGNGLYARACKEGPVFNSKDLLWE